MEKVESKSKVSKLGPKDIVLLTLIIGGFIAYLVMQSLPFVPSGTVIDDKFLNTLKIMTIIKYLVPRFSLGLLFVTAAISSANKQTKWLIIIGAVLLVLSSFLLFSGSEPNPQGIINGIISTPTVTEKTVASKKQNKYVYTLFFEDNTYGHVNNYTYLHLYEGDDVYVVYCDSETIGAFKTSEYTLAE